MLVEKLQTQERREVGYVKRTHENDGFHNYSTRSILVFMTRLDKNFVSNEMGCSQATCEQILKYRGLNYRSFTTSSISPTNNLVIVASIHS